VIARIARSPEQGGGFVAGGVRMCPSNVRGGQTEPMRAEDQPCPPGSGGVIGEQVQEISAEELRRRLEEQRAREATERTRPPEAVEVSGSVQRAGKQELTSVTISSGMTGYTHPTFGSGSGGDPMPNLTVEVDGQSARTNAQGRFTIRAQAPGAVVGRVVDAVGMAQKAVLVVIGGGSAVTDSRGQFRIPLNVSQLRGRVVDGSGRAVGRATVEIEADPANRRGRFDGFFDSVLTGASGVYYGIPYSVRSSAYIAASAQTDGAGVFVVKVPTGNYAVKIRARGFQDRRQGGIHVPIGTLLDVGSVVLVSPLVLEDGVPASGDDMEEKEGKEGGAPASTSWYKSTWFWVGTATVAVGGVSYLVWRQRKRH